MKHSSPIRIASVFSLLLLGGCGTMQNVAQPDPDFAPIRPVGSAPLPANDGAIYKAGYNITLFEDGKARRVGDIITVILDESTNATKSATTSTAKESDIDLPTPTVFGNTMTVNGNDLFRAAVTSDRNFTGEGESEQSNKLTGRISVTVAEVFPNGNLLVRGEKLLTLNQGSEHVRLSGIIRAMDVSPDNTVRSEQIANARIVYGGQGVLADANEKGWLQKVLDSKWWPF
jgi:flagellar L-ring protein precursor FlgH